MRPASIAAVLAATACSAPEPADVPDTYTFVGRDGGDSVAYSGQTFRHLLIEDLKIHMGGLGERLDTGFFPQPGDVAAELDFYFSFDGETAGDVPFLYTTEPPPAQDTYADVASGKDLVGKVAGNDEVGQHRDWSVAFVGWDHDDVTTPESLIRHWFDVVDAQAVAWASGDIPRTSAGEPVPAPYVTPEGQDLRQLTEKFLRGAIALSQAADDYLDDDVDGKGLLSDHTALVEGESFTALEHAWDEGFGYFGAARTYGIWTDEQIADGAVDVDQDGAIDLLTEVSFGHSGNVGKRDLGSVVPTDFTADAWAGFAAGRQLLADTDGALSQVELDLLREHRDRALGAWEAAIAATVVHYVNETLVDMAAMDTDAYSLADHAKHWSELKGFALAFQFNPHSAVSDDDFAELHTLIGQAPVLADADASTRATYADDLRAARALVGNAFGFDPANLGDDDGADGW